MSCLLQKGFGHTIPILLVTIAAFLQQVVHLSCRNKLSVKNVPAEMSDESLKETLTQYGTLKDFTRKNDSVHIAYSTLEEAQE